MGTLYTLFAERLKKNNFFYTFIHREKIVKEYLNCDDIVSNFFFFLKTVMFSAVTIERKDTLKKKKTLGLNFWLS